MNDELLEAAWNDEIVDDLGPLSYDKLVVYSRDWTVETIISQIDKGHIDLNPRFQRRNAWNDERRSRLIESLILGVPIPEIVLAEDPQKKKSFIVIDGKQRLLTAAGFLDPSIEYWTQPRLTGLNSRKDLNGVTVDKMKQDLNLQDAYRALLNSGIRCTIISSYDSTDILFDIFYRLNSGSVPLSTQELRQVLNKGDFANHLIERTSHTSPLHQILGLEEPDPRLRDVELVVRSLSIEFFGNKYRGNLKKFLDDSMGALSRLWDRDHASIETELQQYDLAQQKAVLAIGASRVGRKFANDAWETRFNRSLYEAQVYYFKRTPDQSLTPAANQAFVGGFEELSRADNDFRRSIEATTKTNESYNTRFSRLRDLFNRAYQLNIAEVPVPAQATAQM